MYKLEQQEYVFKEKENIYGIVKVSAMAHYQEVNGQHFE